MPAGEAVAAEPGEVHQVDILYVGPLAQMRDEAAKGGGFERGAGCIVDCGHVHNVHLLTGAACGQRGTCLPYGGLAEPALQRDQRGQKWHLGSGGTGARKSSRPSARQAPRSKCSGSCSRREPMCSGSISATAAMRIMPHGSR
ncbi:hypothetical protein [Acidiphilium sp. PA]|uniref:hypothetical protein n=1 Tax=Acidiphilium sp. PA TaxID=2871705 RepID=UPI0038D196C3